MTSKKIIQEIKVWFWPSVLVLGLSAITRLINLTSLPVFADESIYIRWSQIMIAEPGLRFVPLSDGKPPLFMWVTILFLKYISDPLLAGRLLSALVGISNVAAVVIAAFLLFKNRRLALISGLIWAVVPFAVFFNRLSVADGMLTMFYLWTFIFLSQALKYFRLDLAMLAGFALGFAWLTKSPAFIAIVLSPSLLFLSSSAKLSTVDLIKSVSLILVTLGIGFMMYNILRLGPEFHMIALRNQDYIYPLSDVLRHPLKPLLPHLNDSWIFFLYLLTPFGLVLALLGGFIDRGTNHLKQRLILLIWWLIPIIAQSAVAISLTARYLLYTLPFAVILAAHAVEHVGTHTRKHWLSGIALALIVIPSLIIDYQFAYKPENAPLPRIERSGYLEEWTAGQGIAEAADIIRQAAANGPVVVGSEGYFGTPFSALEMYLNSAKNVRVIGVGVYMDTVSEKLTNALADNQVFLVVNSSRFSGDPAKLGLELLASYPKALQPDNEREYLLFFKVGYPPDTTELK